MTKISIEEMHLNIRGLKAFLKDYPLELKPIFFMVENADFTKVILIPIEEALKNLPLILSCKEWDEYH
ncbi:MAG: hypothetical protein AB1567_02310 [bacterium]